MGPPGSLRPVRRSLALAAWRLAWRTSMVAVAGALALWGLVVFVIMRNAAAAGASARVDARGRHARAPVPRRLIRRRRQQLRDRSDLRRSDVALALREAAPGPAAGRQILIMNLNVDGWIRAALPTLPGHGYFDRAHDTDRWRAGLTEAGFDVVEHGTQPGINCSLGLRNAAAPGR
jgi:hypothetical protein